MRSEKVPAAIIDALPQLKVIVRAGAGYDTIDIKHARKKGVDVMNTPGANANGVAEEVIAMMLADARHIVQADTTTRAGGWEKKNYMGREISGKTVGIVGLGNIGRLVAKRLRASSAASSATTRWSTATACAISASSPPRWRRFSARVITSRSTSRAARARAVWSALS